MARQEQEQLRALIARWRECEAVNRDLAARHHRDGWFTVYTDRRDIYKRCADDLEATVTGIPSRRDEQESSSMVSGAETNQTEASNQQRPAAGNPAKSEAAS